MPPTPRLNVFYALCCVLICLVGSGCADDPNPSIDVDQHNDANSLDANSAPSVDEKSLPPGFLDPAPAPPTSDTIILSGGTLVTQPQVNDSVVVITDQQLIAWGARGKVFVPHDSIGRDMRGKWLIPGTIIAGELVSSDDDLDGSQPLNLVIVDADPANTQATAHVVGTVINGVIDLPEPESN